MFKKDNIKTKISFVLTAITIVFLAVALVAAYAYYNESKRLIIENYNYYVAGTAQILNKGINTVEHNAADLSTIGRTLYEGQISVPLTKRYLVHDLSNYKEANAMGIWFKPYSINPNEKYVAYYPTRNNNNIIFDPIFESDEYNYPERPWYKQITSEIKPGKIVWTIAHAIQTPVDGSQRRYPLLITAGAGIYSNGELIGVSTVDWDFDACVNLLASINPTKNSFILFADKVHNFVFFSTDPNMYGKNAVGKKMEDIPWYDYRIQDLIPFKYNGTRYIPFIEILDNGMLLIVNIPEFEMLGALYSKVLLLVILMGLFSTIFIIMLSSTLREDVMNPIKKLIEMANEISQDNNNNNNNTKIKIDKPAEFALLAETYDKMTESIKEKAAEQTKMNYELSIAKSIQLSSLPSVFPPFPEHKEFSIYASMDPAKDVGGDFYDFYFKDKDNLTLLVADVSGKGVPAALYMMNVKTFMNNLALTNAPSKELVQILNNRLCSNNEQIFFVTLFACIINIKTGNMTCVNCGHNPPLIKRNNGKYEYLDIDPNIALGIEKDFDYKIYRSNLSAGDSIFLYTDGVTEAQNPNEEIYGEKRLEECLNSIGNDMTVDDTIKKVKENIKEFAQEQVQSDDITMLAFQFSNTFRSFERPAVKENYNEFINWIHSICKEWNLNEELSNKIDLCGEEIFANICFYAYPKEVGNIKVSLERNDKELIMMIFEDNGLLYNPLEKPDPDITMSGEERKLGGLGIFMVKQMANHVEYQRVENKNILSLKFNM